MYDTVYIAVYVYLYIKSMYIVMLHANVRLPHVALKAY